MFCKEGIEVDHEGTYLLCLCRQCESSLRASRIPRLALANNLYRGKLPVEFGDLTWVEEMICAIFRGTAHITRLFQSSDPATPRVMYGNTCAHGMNVVSTASVLPRTPADVNYALSVVFVGSQQFDPARLYSLFRVRKSKVCRFLVFLKRHNHLYDNIHIDVSRLELFPDDGPLPGIHDRVIHHR
ncbi:hypothetical protein DEU56DRAFT_738664, partial [Suillus clintonianus]|uniref:uncharacterized protein n=1 Tax=Suillus clintonianus TaxID=1904413 RepID=UPI001B872D86